MSRSIRRALLALATAAALMPAAGPADAQITADLAKRCRELMVKAHPTDRFSPSGSAEKQRAYFQECIKRQGRMEDGRAQGETPAGTTGQGGQ
jgi:hypothetical protein